MKKVEQKDIEAVYPLSPMQQGMLFHSLKNPETGVYFEQLTCSLLGDVDVPAFEKAFKTVLERHSVLRTAFVWKKLDRLLQVVHRNVELPLVVLDWSDLSKEEQPLYLIPVGYKK